MRLVDYLDKGAGLGPDAPCLRSADRVLSYRQVQEISDEVARGLAGSGVGPGDSVAILSANDPIAFASVFGISRAGAVWCPINPRNAAGENRQLLELMDCRALLFQRAFADLVAQILPDLPGLKLVVCIDADGDPPNGALDFAQWTAQAPAPQRRDGDRVAIDPVDDTAMIVGTGGTTGLPKGVRLSGRNIETMTAIVLMSYPFPTTRRRPVYLALAPLTHAAGVLSFPILTLGGEIVIMAHPDVGEFLHLIEQHRVTHTMLPPTLLYMALAHPDIDTVDTSSLECFWYGSAPMSAAKLEQALHRFGPVLAQYFGQTEAPMVATTMSPADHYRPDGSIAVERLASAGRAAPLVTLAIMDEEGRQLSSGQRGEIVLRSSLVMQGYHHNPDATAEVSRFGWHHTGDIGYLDEDGFLFIVDRAKDMIITGGFNVYSAEVEQAVMEHPAIQDCAVFGVPDEKWGERVTAVVQLRNGATVDTAELHAFVRTRLGGVKAPKEYLVWDDLPRSKVGKVLKRDIRDSILGES